MKVVFFVHSLRSCWNHGNAHFLRGVVSNLRRRGHEVRVYEPDAGWSVTQLLQDQGRIPLDELDRAYPDLRLGSDGVSRYGDDGPDLDEALDRADLVIVHEWNDPGLVARIGRRRARGAPFALLFHDTHHRSVTAPHEIEAMDLSGYDGVLAFGDAIREVYARRGWSRAAFTWHEAADVDVFRPLERVPRRADLVWVGNWGDDERVAELREFLIGPVQALGITGTVHGVRYPEHALATLRASGLTYRGWVANHRVPEVFAAHAVTVHVPRGPYAAALPGVPTIRVFEALACGIPLVSAPWNDEEGLFTPGRDFLVAHDGAEMQRHLRDLLADDALAAELAASGLATIRARHTTAHRVDELLHIVEALRGPALREAIA